MDSLGSGFWIVNARVRGRRAEGAEGGPLTSDSAEEPLTPMLDNA